MTPADGQQDQRHEPATRVSDAPQRWQKIAIDQLGYLLNLILALTIGALAYDFGLLRDASFRPSCPAKCLMIGSITALAFSAMAGLVCAFVRLYDFRGTARRARKRPSAPSREDLRFLDKAVWVLLHIQTISFALGITMVFVALLLSFGNKLA